MSVNDDSDFRSSSEDSLAAEFLPVEPEQEFFDAVDDRADDTDASDDNSDTGEICSPLTVGSARPVKGESFCDCYESGKEKHCTCGEEDSYFDWVWDNDTKSFASYLKQDQREVVFHVDYSCGTAAVRGTIPMVEDQYYWEVKMTTPVYGTDMNYSPDRELLGSLIVHGQSVVVVKIYMYYLADYVAELDTFYLKEENTLEENVQMVGVGTADLDLNKYRHKFCSLIGRDSDGWGLSYTGMVQHKGQKHSFSSKFGQGTIIGLHLDMWRGTLAFYKNRKPLGIAYRGLQGKTLFPVVSSTAARSGMKVIKCRSFKTSLQFMCCQILRQVIPRHLDVLKVIDMPPGLREFLDNNIYWLLQPCPLEASDNVDHSSRSRGTKRRYECSDDEDGPSTSKHHKL